MSNTIINQLSVFGQPNDIEKLIKDICPTDRKRGTISFERIIPCPLDPIVTPQAERIAWNKARWGTKSDAFNCETDDFNGETFMFSTEWSSASTIIGILAAQYTHLSFILYAADSNFGEGVEAYGWQHGTIDKVDIMPAYSNRAIELATALHGYSSITDAGWAYDEQTKRYHEVKQ